MSNRAESVQSKVYESGTKRKTTFLLNFKSFYL